MIYSMEIGRHLRCINEDRTGKFFVEGDTIDCYLKDGKKYTGTISRIGFFTENSKSGLEPVIQLDTSKSQRSYSGEIIQINDLILICKKQDNMEQLPIEREPDRDAFLKVFKDTDYEEKFAKYIYDKMRYIIAVYDIPVIKAAECAVYALDNQCGFEDTLKHRYGITLKLTEKENVQA